MIKPTVGRIVYFYYFPNSEPLPAIITYVHEDRCINAAIFDGDGIPFKDPPTSIILIQPEDERPQNECFCEWMPYQVKKLTGSESGEQQVGTQII